MINFVLILLLVIGLVWANVALLRRGSKPMVRTPVSRSKAEKADSSADAKLHAVVSTTPPIAQQAAAALAAEQPQAADKPNMHNAGTSQNNTSAKDETTTSHSETANHSASSPTSATDHQV